MIIKKFVAKTEEEATKAAKSEMGEGVVIMNVRTVKPGGFFGFFKSAQVEVTAAIEEVSDKPVSGVKPANLPSYRNGDKKQHTMSLDKGSKAPEAAGKIHSDIERGFIRAEVVSFDDLVKAGNMQAAKEKGLIRSEGKDYVMRDGDIVLFRFNVSK